MTDSEAVTDAGRTPARRRLERASWCWYWGIVAAWMLVISLFSSELFSASNTHRYVDPVLRYFFPHMTVRDITAAHTVIRKTAHFLEFFVLGALAYWASRRGRTPRWRLRWMLQAMALATAYALVDEFHQRFVPNRTASFADTGVDSLGTAASQAVIYVRHVVLARFTPR